MSARIEQQLAREMIRLMEAAIAAASKNIDPLGMLTADEAAAQLSVAEVDMILADLIDNDSVVQTLLRTLAVTADRGPTHPVVLLVQDQASPTGLNEVLVQVEGREYLDGKSDAYGAAVNRAARARGIDPDNIEDFYPPSFSAQFTAIPDQGATP